MPRPAPGDDATVVMRPAPVAAPVAAPAAVPPAPKRRAGPAAAAVLLALIAAGGAFWLLRPPPVAPVAVLPAPRPAPSPAFTLATADEAAIRADIPDGLAIFRYAPEPRVVVLDFASLREQGEMLNRVAALVEKAGLPRDRVLSDAELDAAIRASGDTVETFYYGHDYPAAALARFFALADAQHVTLDAQEERLRALLRQLGWLAPDAAGALISIPRTGADANVDAAARAALLHHELSHGAFFTDPHYAAYVRGFWHDALTSAERDGMRRFLGSQGYDTADEELMLNEMQAYVMFTADPRFFKAENMAITPERRRQLQEAFLRDMPSGWLKETLVKDLLTR